MAKSFSKYGLFIWFAFCNNILCSQWVLRDAIIREAKSHIGVAVEKTNNNDGFYIETFILKPLGLPKGSAYCAAYISVVYNNCGIQNHPNSAWSPAWAKEEDMVYKKNHFGKISNTMKADVVSFWISKKNRVGHVGIFERIQGSYIYTIEGNTSDMNDKGRDGVWGKVRHESSIYSVTTYIR
mgnify:CR=1 FL=1|jgi:hypothetical protein